MARFTDKNGKKKSMTSSEEAYKKLAWYENDEDRGVIPEEYVYEPDKRSTGCQKCGAIDCLKGGLKECKGYEAK